jgi:hypothetical protein
MKAIIPYKAHSVAVQLMKGIFKRGFEDRGPESEY